MRKVKTRVSKPTLKAEGACWEMKCAIEEDIPIIGVHIHKDDKGAVPPELKGKKVINWTWVGIANFIGMSLRFLERLLVILALLL